jgi:hypothetical protein
VVHRRPSAVDGAPRRRIITIGNGRADGMAVTVEIKTGSRAVITYLLSPLMRYKQESLRER